MLVRPRSSRIYYKGKFFTYPLRATEALLKLGLVESVRCVLSYAWARLAPCQGAAKLRRLGQQPVRPTFVPDLLQDVYGEGLGMSCKEISADWAAQRIKGLSLASAVLNAISTATPSARRGAVIKTLIDTFRYPRRGPGMMWEACAARIRDMGGDVRMGATVVGCRWDRDNPSLDDRLRERRGTTGIRSFVEHLISSAPIRELVRSITPTMSDAARSAAAALRYRDFSPWCSS